MQLNGKTILITGASTGIGRALVYNSAMKKCNLILLSRRKKLLDEIIRDLKGNNQNITAIKCDVSKKRDVTKAFEKIKKKFKRIDIAILNAGIGRNVPITKYNSNHAEDIFGVNVIGMVYCVEQLLPHFLKRKAGMIVGVSSLADNRGYSGSGFYSASKAATTIFLEGLSVELRPYNIKVVTVKPGFVKTPMTDKNKYKMPFIISAEKAAEIILNGIKKEKRYIQFPLSTLLITKIIGLIPNFIYEIAASKIKLK
ncbi:MAG: alcohol dehydrogenase [Ignavibacteria bacterium RBG_13_36_8]|nr:MAG: alcohol dehydrogenase [Ignavibacteria bacterium RBG_13_36_8]